MKCEFHKVWVIHMYTGNVVSSLQNPLYRSKRSFFSTAKSDRKPQTYCPCRLLRKVNAWVVIKRCKYKATVDTRCARVYYYDYDGRSLRGSSFQSGLL